MRILLLSPYGSELRTFLQDLGNQVKVYSDKISKQFLTEYKFDLIISYGYRHILSSDILSYSPNAFLNLHISFLPYNRGADPNLWSILEDTTSGVSIHKLDSGIDTGDILLQERCDFEFEELTFADTYFSLHRSLTYLFKTNWEDLKDGAVEPKKQNSQGTFHKLSDSKSIGFVLEHSWHTRVTKAKSLYLAHLQSLGYSDTTCRHSISPDILRS